MEEIQVSMQDVIDKLKERISNDAQNMAILDATVDACRIKIQELNNALDIMRAEEIERTGLEN